MSELCMKQKEPEGMEEDMEETVTQLEKRI